MWVPAHRTSGRETPSGSVMVARAGLLTSATRACSQGEVCNQGQQAELSSTEAGFMVALVVRFVVGRRPPSRMSVQVIMSHSR